MKQFIEKKSPFLKCLILTTILLTVYTQSNAAEPTKGLLPEVRLNSDNEEQNQQKALQSELLISKAESKAIDSLTRIIIKKKGTPEEADLLFRLAELYMRKAKSGRFFDLNNQATVNNTGPVDNKKSQEALRSAVLIYNRLEKNFPKFKNLDAVYFNSALAHLQTKQVERAKQLYDQMITLFPKSNLVADTLLESGEIYYNQQHFEEALQRFKAIEKFPQSKAYPYGLYKSAWCYYNLKKTDEGIKQLITVINDNPSTSSDQKKYNLRKEALRDLTLFAGEVLPPEKLYSFFEKITTKDELGEAIISLASLYESHSKFKEITIFVQKFINENPQSPLTIKCYAKLIETNETLKQRESVIALMKKMGEVCQSNNITSNNEPSDKTCQEQFRSVNLEISKKWWEIWLKNKNNLEFSKLTEQAFEILLKYDDITQPDSKSRFAYAELLFQLEKYDKASLNYEEVSEHKKIDKTLSHDSLYGALYSLEKQLEKKDDLSQVERQKALAQRYLKEFPQGDHHFELEFKLGFIAYKQNNYDEALNRLKPLAKNSKASYEIKSKSEDIVLDIYNIKKDFKSIQDFAKQIVSMHNSNATDRKQNLNKIIEEAHYSQIQTEIAQLPLLKQIEQLKAFNTEHPKTKLARDSYWQAISLAYSNGYDVLGAELTQEYVKIFPDDPRKLDATKESVKAFIDAGQIKQAITAVRDLARLDAAQSFKHLELSCDLLSVNNQKPEARGCYRGLLEKADKQKKSTLLTKILNSLKGSQNESELASIENEILKENIEPYATQILIDQAQKLLSEKKFSQAFNLSLKINSRPVSADQRAESRLIQAAVLEREFVLQSVKAREDKFATVLGMKTEKLDKAFTAFSTTIKMSKSSRIQTEALQGIDRLYSHFIESISNMPLPATLKPEDQLALREELAKLTKPFEKKKVDNLAQLRKISQLSTNRSEEVNWAELSFEKTIEPRLIFPSAQTLSVFLPTQFQTSDKGYGRLPASEKKCDPKSLSATSLGSCLNLKKYSDVEKMSFQLTATKENRAIGLYYLSLLADRLNENEKSLWMIEKALALDNENSILLYQKGKALYSIEGLNSALPFFEKVIDLKKTSPDLIIMSALKSYSDRDFISASEEFAKLSQEEIFLYNAGLLYIESLAQRGETDKALKLSSVFLNSKGDSVDMWIEQARIYEQFSFNKTEAIKSYQKALAKSAIAEQKEWLKKKVDFLKSTSDKPVSLNN